MQHKLDDGLNDIRKWAKMAERYSNTLLDSGKDIFEIKSTLNDLANWLDKTQLRAITPERKTFQFTESTRTRTYSREPLPTAPVRNFDPITGQRLNNAPVYDVITGEHLQSSTPPRQHQEGYQDLPPYRNRSPSPYYNNTGQNHNEQNYNRSLSAQQDNNKQYSRWKNTQHIYSRLPSPQQYNIQHKSKNNDITK